MLNPPRQGVQVTTPILPQSTPLEVATAIEDRVRDVLDRHGMSAFEMTREAALGHEAGHAIVGTHEGFPIRQVAIFSQPIAKIGTIWTGPCLWTAASATWTTGPDTSAADDLRYARMIIAGLAGEAMIGCDKPGSSIDELAVSQMLGHNAATKLCDLRQSDAELDAQEKQLWHEQVWKVALAIIDNNREPFMTIMGHLNERELVKGGRLRAALAQVKRVPS